MLKDEIFKSANKIVEEKMKKGGADKAPLQYQDKLEIIVSKSKKSNQENSNAQ